VPCEEWLRHWGWLSMEERRVQGDLMGCQDPPGGSRSWSQTLYSGAW